MPRHRSLWAGLLTLAALAAAGCGSSTPAVTAPATTPATSSTPTQTHTTAAAQPSGGGAGVLSAEANSAATGDIPDNQVFLVFTNKGAGYAMKYPEGWTQSGSARKTTISNKNNLV